ncbi:MAG: RRXRR domain-containing protein [Deltaproteobacteria bacterium]|nr:RRXRR domain-containing protein [Deltaproteobacteria bacterium]
MKVFVVDKNNKSLAPCSPKRARQLREKKKRAKFDKMVPTCQRSLSKVINFTAQFREGKLIHRESRV